MVQTRVTVRQPNSVGNGLRPVPLDPERRGGRSLQSPPDCYPAIPVAGGGPRTPRRAFPTEPAGLLPRPPRCRRRTRNAAEGVPYRARRIATLTVDKLNHARFLNSAASRRSGDRPSRSGPVDILEHQVDELFRGLGQDPLPQRLAHTAALQDQIDFFPQGNPGQRPECSPGPHRGTFRGLFHKSLPKRPYGIPGPVRRPPAAPARDPARRRADPGGLR